MELCRCGDRFSSQATLEDLGQIYRNEKTGEPITREAVRITIARGMRRLWENSSDEVKSAFPWDRESIPLKKPWTLKSRLRGSLASGGSALLLKDIQGGRNYQELRETGKSAQEIRASRRVLRQWGFHGDLPYGELGGELHSRFIQRLEAAQTPQEVQALFNQIRRGAFVYDTINRGNLPLTKLTTVLSTCGFNPYDSRNKHIFVEALEAGRVVVGHTEYKVKNGSQAGQIQRYYFIRTKDVPAAEQILRNNPS